MHKLAFLFGCLGVCLLVSMGAYGGLAAGPANCPARQCVYLPLVEKGSGVQVRATTTMRTRGGDEYLYGDVVNLTSSPVYSVTLQTLYYSEDGELVDMSEHTTELPVIFPGQAVPFWGGSYEWIDYDYLRLEVSVTGYRTNTQHVYEPVTIVSQRVNNYTNYAAVSGEIGNDSRQALQFVEAVVWSIEGHVAPHSVTISETALAPGQTTNYDALLYPPRYDEFNQVPSKLSMAGQGEVVP